MRFSSCGDRKSTGIVYDTGLILSCDGAMALVGGLASKFESSRGEGTLLLWIVGVGETKNEFAR